MNDVSNFHIVSLGYVAKDIVEDDLYIDVYPVELHPGVVSEISEATEVKASNSDVDSKQENIKVVKSAMVKAKWLPLGDNNRLEPPTVCKGETVLLYKFGNADKYFWTNPYNELHLRKREKRTMVYSNRGTISGKLADLKNCYYYTIDTINKYLNLHTSKNDGEYTTYDFDIDTKKGTFTVIDGKGNHIILNSVEDKITILTKKDIYTNTTNTTNVIGNNKKETIGSHYSIDLKTYSVSNGADELMALLVELIQANIDVMHVGNLGINTAISSPSEAVYKDIQSRVKAFIK